MVIGLPFFQRENRENFSPGIAISCNIHILEEVGTRIYFIPGWVEGVLW